MLVTGSLDNTLKLWNLKNKEMIYSIKAEECWRGMESSVETIGIRAASSALICLLQ